MTFHQDLMQGLACQGEKGWGQKGIAIWRWKNELPATYPEVLLWKIPGGRAVLMSMDYCVRNTIRNIIDR